MPDVAVLCSCTDVSVCSRCVARYARQLGDVPALLGELEVSAARLGRAGSLARGSGKGSAVPLPFDQSASDLVREISGTLVAWAEAVRLDLHIPARGVAGIPVDLAVGLLLRERGWVSDGPGAGELVRWLDGATSAARRTILGRQRDRWFAGVCGADVVRFEDVDGVLTPFILRCESRLFAPTHATEVRCGDCEASWSVASRRAQLVLYAQEFELPLRTITGALPWLAGVGVKPATVRSWVRSRLARQRTFVISPAGVAEVLARLRRPPMLAPRSVDVDGVELFRVGDVIDLAVEAARRSTARPRLVVDTMETH